MNRYYMIRRLRAPIFLMLLGTLFILAQMSIVSFKNSWPLILIYFGVMMLVERAVLAIDGYPVPPAFNAPVATEQPAASTINTDGATDTINTGSSKGVQL